MQNRAGRIFDDPRKLTYQLVKKITNDFTDELGRDLIKSSKSKTLLKDDRMWGLLEDGEEVAVKVLHYFTPDSSDQQFQNEFENLKRLKHPNIVRLVGFCDETEDEIVEYKGEIVVAKRIHRALCLEYVPNGSLGKLLSGSVYPKFLNINVLVIHLLCVSTLKVHESWNRRLQEIPNYESLEVDCKQVKICIEIAINCMEKNRRKRPTIKDIISKLDETGTVEVVSHFQMKKNTKVGGNKEPVILSSGIVGGPYKGWLRYI
ncbi:unnamed protein product [Miscanthus lutarioriparius]|uniref:Protein kinase domain-containing protein n=1 Tax=Miscanthus lutarioriparius TaxID=422564 RepID=A0A811QN01_9POAL|nr:unnamed protein product [Miscanthus lutarioriparius]